MIMTTLMVKILQYCNMVAPRYIPRIESVDSKNIKDQILYTYGVKLFNGKYVIIRICPQLYFSDTLFS